MRNYRLDILKSSAIIGVIIIHVVALIVNRPPQVANTLLWIFLSVLNITFRWAVPVFVMVSGVLMLSTPISNFKEFYKKRFIRILIPFSLWLVIYGIASFYFHQNSSLKEFLIKTFVFGNPYSHLYYVFVILGLYVLTPWLNLFVHAVETRRLHQLIILILASTSLWSMAVYWVMHIWPQTVLLSFTLWLPYLGYYLSGYYFFHHPIRLKNPLIIFGLILFTTLVDYFFITRFDVSSKGLMIRDYWSPFVIVESLLVFSFVVNFPTKILNRFRTVIITELSVASFGIYLSHQLIIDIILNRFPSLSSQPNLFWLFILGLFSLIFAYIVTKIVSLIPYIGYVSGYAYITKNHRFSAR